MGKGHLSGGRKKNMIKKKLKKETGTKN